MSGVGFSELIILFLIGLIVLGPERLPKVANQMGTWLGQARRMTRVMKRQLEEELNLEGTAPTASPYPRSRAEQFPPKAPPATTAPPPEASTADPAPEMDDSYSPAHAADEPGTGLGDDVAGSGEPAAVEPRSADAPRADGATQEKEKTQ